LPFSFLVGRQCGAVNDSSGWSLVIILRSLNTCNDVYIVVPDKLDSRGGKRRSAPTAAHKRVDRRIVANNNLSASGRRRRRTDVFPCDVAVSARFDERAMTGVKYTATRTTCDWVPGGRAAPAGAVALMES